MSAVAPAPPAAATPVATRSAPLGAGYRFELVKQLAQWRMRLLALVCLLAPALFVGVVSRQSSLPADTVFGRWMNTTGWAGALVVLGFCCSWALPLLVSVVAGDVFAAEDRLGTWRHLLMAMRSPRRIFLVKVLASLTLIALLMLVLAVSAAVGGVVSVGNHPLIGLDGQSIAPGDAALKVLLAWVCVLSPTLAFAGVGLLGSVTLGRSPMGLLVPAVLAIALQLLQMLPLPLALRLALPGSAMITWRGLFADPVQAGPLLVGIAVGLAWAVVGTLAAYLLFVRRDFTNTAYDGGGRRAVAVGVLPLVALTAACVLVIAVATPVSGSGIDRAKLERGMATAYGHLYRLQERELHRPDVTEAHLRTSASCDKGGDLTADVGAGNDWRCVVSWHIPGSTVVGQATYQLDVTADGRYVADGDGPKEVNGYFVVHTSSGDAPNPLWQIDGVVDLLTSTTKE